MLQITFARVYFLNRMYKFLFRVCSIVRWRFIEKLRQKVEGDRDDLHQTPPDKYFNSHVRFLIYPTVSGLATNILPHFTGAVDYRP